MIAVSCVRAEGGHVGGLAEGDDAAASWPMVIGAVESVCCIRTSAPCSISASAASASCAGSNQE
jgi:hypothetical protein